MIVTTNYDCGSGAGLRRRGRGVRPRGVSAPNRRGPTGASSSMSRGEQRSRVDHRAERVPRFPIDRYDELERTVIVKMHGAVEGGEGAIRWDRNYVLTEDQYIDYLATTRSARLIPFQILNKLTSSHCLFLGYAMRDWSLRVFLKRVWQGRPVADKSWAIERHADPLEKDAWKSLQVELLLGLARRLRERASTRACANGAPTGRSAWAPPPRPHRRRPRSPYLGLQLSTPRPTPSGSSAATTSAQTIIGNLARRPPDDPLREKRRRQELAAASRRRPSAAETRATTARPLAARPGYLPWCSAPGRTTPSTT